MIQNGLDWLLLVCGLSMDVKWMKNRLVHLTSVNNIHTMPQTVETLYGRTVAVFLVGTEFGRVLSGKKRDNPP